MTNKELGIENFRRRLAFGIRDSVLSKLNSPSGTSKITGIPTDELGVLSDLRDDERQSLISVIAPMLDQAIDNFLYGLDNQADGFEIRYNGDLLNEEPLYQLSNPKLPPIAAESQFDANGQPRKENS